MCILSTKSWTFILLSKGNNDFIKISYIIENDEKGAFFDSF